MENETKEKDETREERKETLIKSASSPDLKKIGDMGLLELVDTLNANVAFVQGVLNLMYATNVSDVGSLDDIDDLCCILTDADLRLDIVRDLNQEIWDRVKDKCKLNCD